MKVAMSLVVLAVLAINVAGENVANGFVFQGTSGITKKILSELETQAAAYTAAYNQAKDSLIGANYCGGSAIGDEGCAIFSDCSCNSPLTCDTNSGTCVTYSGVTLCSGACRAPVWIWIIMVVVILAICCGCYACCKRRRAQQAVIMINGPAAQQGYAPAPGGYAPPPVGYAQAVPMNGQQQYPPQQYPQAYAQPYGQPPAQYAPQTTNYQPLPRQN